jgi:hypothetical protein
MGGMPPANWASEHESFAKSKKTTMNVIPAKAGIEKTQMVIKGPAPGFRRGDDFLRVHQTRRFDNNLTFLYRPAYKSN